MVARPCLVWLLVGASACTKTLQVQIRVGSWVKSNPPCFSLPSSLRKSVIKKMGNPGLLVYLCSRMPKYLVLLELSLPGTPLPACEEQPFLQSAGSLT